MPQRKKDNFSSTVHLKTHFVNAGSSCQYLLCCFCLLSRTVGFFSFYLSNSCTPNSQIIYAFISTFAELPISCYYTPSLNPFLLSGSLFHHLSLPCHLSPTSSTKDLHCDRHLFLPFFQSHQSIYI